MYLTILQSTNCERLNRVENVDWNYLKTQYQSYLVQIVLIMNNKCSQANIVHTTLLIALITSNVPSQISAFKSTDYGGVFARHYFDLGLNKKLFNVDFNNNLSRSYGVVIYILHESESSMIGKI